MRPLRNPRRPSGTKRFFEALQTLAPFALVAALAVLFLARARLVEAAAGTYTGCNGCFLIPTLGADAWLLAAACGLLSLAQVVRYRWLSVPVRLVVVVLGVIATVDVIVFDLLTQRLHLGDVSRFGGEFAANWSVLRASLASPLGALKVVAATAWLLLLALVCLPGQQQRAGALVLALLAMCSVVAAALIRMQMPVHFVHGAMTRNVIEINLPQSSMRDFSVEFIGAQRSRVAQLSRICERNPSARRPDVIVVLAESLSSWQSRLLGSPLDWTPRLDRIARDNHYFTHFYANGFTTSGAEVAIGSGLLPINPPDALEYNFRHFSNEPDALPGVARSAGYQSQFFTPGDTGFLGVGDWLREIGFDEVHGSDDAYYDGHERWQFHSVEDSVFYARFLQWLAARDAGQPFVSVLLNVSSHPPFINPHSHRIDPEGSFRYVDEQVGQLYDALREQGFFEHGILVVMGDHRTMTPLRAEEYAHFGERAYARVPMIVAGSIDMPAVIEEPFQQTDLLPSLAWQFGVEHCRSPYAGSFLRPDPQPPALIVHARGDDRNRIDIYHGEDGVSAFQLDGDDSRWLDKPPPDADRVAAWINVQRADAVKRAKR